MTSSGTMNEMSDAPNTRKCRDCGTDIFRYPWFMSRCPDCEEKESQRVREEMRDHNERASRYEKIMAIRTLASNTCTTCGRDISRGPRCKGHEGKPWWVRHCLECIEAGTCDAKVLEVACSDCGRYLLTRIDSARKTALCPDCYTKSFFPYTREDTLDSLDRYEHERYYHRPD